MASRLRSENEPSQSPIVLNTSIRERIKRACRTPAKNPRVSMARGVNLANCRRGGDAIRNAKRIARPNHWISRRRLRSDRRRYTIGKAVDAGSKGTEARANGRGRTGVRASVSEARPLPAFYYRLSARAQRCYLKSDALDRYVLAASPAAITIASRLAAVLPTAAPSLAQRGAQALGNELCRLLGVAPVRIEVRGVRPHNARGELHGIFYPDGTGRIQAPGSPAAPRRDREPLIVLWMRTAQRHDVVKPRTFIRTMMHELGHYFDYAHFRFDDSFHTGGFFKRESFLIRALFPDSADAQRPE